MTFQLVDATTCVTIVIEASVMQNVINCFFYKMLSLGWCCERD